MSNLPHDKYEQDLKVLRELLKEDKKDRKDSIVLHRICQRLSFYKKLTTTIMQDMHSEVMMNFLEGASYEAHSKGAVLIRENDSENPKAYVLLSGQAGVFKTNYGFEKNMYAFTDKNKSKNEKDSIDNEKKTVLQLGGNTKRFSFERMRQILKEDLKEIVQQNLHEENSTKRLYEGIDEKFQTKLQEFGVFVHRIGVGEIFGEIALATESLRTASVVVLEDCELLVLTRQNFSFIKQFYTEDYLMKKADLEHFLPQTYLIEENKRLAHFVQSFTAISAFRVDFFLLFRMIRS